MQMDPVLHLSYMAWATRLVLDAAKALPTAEYEKDRHSSHGGIKTTLSHMYVADALWFSRIAGEPFAKISDVPIPGSLQELDKEWTTLLDRWARWVGQLQSNNYGMEVGYTNTEGIAYRTPLWQIVLHLVNHSTHHRGQVVAMMRQAGAQPPGTDLIVYYRSLEKQAAAS
jgi:uncharacterized damage-inducible protein DinB